VPAQHPARIGFLLSQLGAHASGRFDDRVAELGLSAQQAGVLRMLGRAPGVSQRDLADRLGIVQSRMVALIDGLEALQLVTRIRSSADRRSYRLALTDSGRERLAELRRIAEANESELTASLDARQRDELFDLLRTLANSLGLDEEVHAGYRAARAAPGR
jgi:DNA-binding MarR family transcriptional regulator